MDMTRYGCRDVRRETASTNYERNIRLDRLKERVVGEPGAFVAENYRTKRDFAFYGKNYG